jgi:hypothetical protein
MVPNLRSINPCSRTGAPIHTLRFRQRGSVLAAILLVTIVLLLIVSTLVNTYYTTESNAIDRHLVETQVLWAQFGALDIVRRRVEDTTLAAPPIDNIQKTTLVTSSYPTGTGSNLSYDGFYTFKFATPTIKEYPPIGATHGRLRLEIPIEIVELSPPPMLEDFPTWRKSLFVDICIGTVPPTLLTQHTDTCDAGSVTGNLNLYIHAIHRN